MLKKLSTVLIVLIAFSFAALTFAQDRNVKTPVGKVIKPGQERIVMPSNLNKTKFPNNSLSKVTPNTSSSRKLHFDNVQGVIDTLSVREMLGGDWTNGGDGFGQSAQDVMVQWYQASADLLIKAVGLGTSTNENNQPCAVKIVKMINYTKDSVAALSGSSTKIGLYPGDGDGYNNVAPFIKDGTGDATGDWISNNGHQPAYEWPELWSDDGIGYPLVPEAKPYADNAYDWVVMNDGLGFEPEVKRGEYFGIVVSNTGNSVDDRQAFWAQGSDAYALMKFYEYANGTGWLWRPLALDLVAIVDLIGDQAPTVADMTVLPTTLSTEAREVSATITDENPSGGDAGVASAVIKYSVDGGDYQDAAMTASGDVWTGSIPGQQPGSSVTYYIEATDVAGTVGESNKVTYNIFKPTEGYSTLIVFNGLEGVSGYPQSYYFGAGDWPNSYATLELGADYWAFGSLTEQLVNYYSNIIEICTNGPSVLNSSVIKAWIEADASHNYMLAGDEWLGAQTGWTDTTYVAGDFHYDILGIGADHNDVNYAASGDQGLPSEVRPQEGSMLGGPLYNLYTQVSSDSGWAVPMLYDPYYEIGVTNWMDGVDFLSDVEVDMVGVGIDGNEYSIGGHRTLPAGNKIVFFTYDPLSLDSQGDEGLEYYWYGFSDMAPQVEVLNWFGVKVDVENTDNQIPDSYSLTQNYPNPFNPTTTLEFSIPTSGHVTLKVFDVLGREVATLVNDEKKAGNYSVNFDASNLASGLYIYTINADNFTMSKKMMLLK